MLAATAKIGSKHLVQVEVLQSIRSQLEQLPAKQKTMLDFRDAVAFLYPGIKDAVQKNYSKDEILQIIVNAGWAITHNSFRYLWSLFLSEDENPCKKKSAHKSICKERRDASRGAVKKNNDYVPANLNAASDVQEEITKTDSHEHSMTNEAIVSANEISTPDNNNANPIPQNSALFELPPDSDDL